MLPRHWPTLAGTALLVVWFAVPVATMRRKSATFDEVSHLPAGYTYLTTGLVKLNRQHPPLVKQLCALPLLALHPRTIDRATLAALDPPPTFEWDFGRAFLFGQEADRILFWGRIPAALMTLALAGLVWVWGRRLFGPQAALLPLALVVFDPTITAHGQLVTTDVGCALFSLLFVFLLRAYTERPGAGARLLAGAGLGLALACKFSALVLLPVATALLLGWHLARDRSASRVSWRAAAAALADVAAMVCVAVAVLWLLYGLPGDPLFYVEGLRTVNADHDPHYQQYLMGQFRVGGWRYYLAVAALVKTPLPALLALFGAALVAVRRWRTLSFDDACLVLPAAVYFVGASLAADNYGYRYLIPCLPFLYLFAGRMATWAQAGGSRRRALVLGLVCWSAAEYAAIAPDHLSYFNEIAGGWRGGVRWLNDSNVDWGQGLIQLREWLEAERVQDYSFCYFGSAPLEYYGLRGSACSEAFVQAPPSGTLIVSAHLLAQWSAWLTGLHGNGPRNWIAHQRPSAVVGHALYVYQIP